MTKLWLYIHLPTWPIDRLRRSVGRRKTAGSDHHTRPTACLLFVERQGRQEVVMGCGVSTAQGVRPGMTVAQASALLDRPVAAKASEPEQDAVASQSLARWCLRFTPRVVAEICGDGACGLVLDMTGCDRLYRGPHRMVEVVVARLRQLGLNVRASLSVTRHGAAALARCDASSISLALSHDELTHRLAVLPIEALRLEPREIVGLNEVGIDRIDQLRAVPRDEMLTRFGPGVLRRLDLAWGDAACEDIEPVRRWEPPRVEMRFAGPTTQLEAVEQATQRLAHQLADRLRHRLRSAAALLLEAERLDQNLRPEFVSATVNLSRPSRDGKHLWTMLRPHVERLHLGHGIEALTLTAKRAPRVGLSQMGPASDQVNNAALAAAEAELVDLLSSRLGPQRVLRPVAVATHVPEAAVRWAPAIEAGAGSCQSETDKHPAWSEAPLALRPTSWLDPIESAEVTLLNPEGPVLSLRWRGVTRRLTHSIGPERIAPRWWKAAARRLVVKTYHDSDADCSPNDSDSPRPMHRKVDALANAEAEPPGDDPTLTAPSSPTLWSDIAARDYYRVQDEQGLWLWVFRRLDTGRWFVHGLWL